VVRANHHTIADLSDATILVRARTGESGELALLRLRDDVIADNHTAANRNVGSVNFLHRRLWCTSGYECASCSGGSSQEETTTGARGDIRTHGTEITFI